MITGNLNDNTARHLEKCLPWIRACFDWLSEGRAWEDSPNEVCEGIVVKRVEYVTATPSACRFENHDREVDVQVVVEGGEWIDLSRPERVGEAADSNLAGDVFFFNAPDGPVTRIPLVAGGFAVFFPEDVHRCGAALGEPARLKKYVFKVSRQHFGI